jgi:hypothetical protein
MLVNGDTLFAVIYVSSASQSFTLEQAMQIASARQEFARSRNTTGLLVYASGNFLRYIEGRESDVRAVANEERIKAPQQDVINLYEGPINHLYFENYNMAVKIIGSKELQPMDTFNDADSIEHLQLCLSMDDKAMRVIKRFIKSNH